MEITSTLATSATAWRIVDTTTGDPLPGLHESHRAAQEWVAARDWADDRGLTIVEAHDVPAAPSVPWAASVRLFEEVGPLFTAQAERAILSQSDLPGVVVFASFELVDGEWLPATAAQVEVDTDDERGDMSDPDGVRTLAAALSRAADLLDTIAAGEQR